MVSSRIGSGLLTSSSWRAGGAPWATGAVVVAALSPLMTPGSAPVGGEVASAMAPIRAVNSCSLSPGFPGFVFSDWWNWMFFADKELSSCSACAACVIGSCACSSVACCRLCCCSSAVAPASGGIVWCCLLRSIGSPVVPEAASGTAWAWPVGSCLRGGGLVTPVSAAV